MEEYMFTHLIKINRIPFNYTQNLSTMLLYTFLDRDDCVVLGHDSNAMFWNDIQEYKLVEQVGDETHEHLLVGVGEHVCVIRTRIFTPAGVRVINHTQPIMDLLKLWCYADDSRTPLYPIQRLVLRKLKHATLTTVNYNEGVADALEQTAQCMQHELFNCLPPTVSALYNLTNIPGLYEDLMLGIRNNVPMPRLLRQLFSYNELRFATGLAYKQVASNSTLWFTLDLFPRQITMTKRALPEDVVLILNPHLDIDFAGSKSGGSSVWYNLREAYFHLIDIVSHSRFSELSITLHMLETPTLRINYYYDPYTFDTFSMPWECTVTDHQFDRIGLHYEDLLITIGNIATMLNYGAGRYTKYDVTVCRTVHETMCLFFELEGDGGDTRIVHYIDMGLSYLMSPAVLVGRV
jgi:hypothetical protein